MRLTNNFNIYVWRKVRIGTIPKIVLRKVRILTLWYNTSTVLELRKGFWQLIERVKVSAQSGNLWDKVGIDYLI